MNVIALRQQLVRARRHLTAMAAVLTLAAAIAVHHNGMAMGATHDHHGMSLAIEMCLGVLTAVGTAVTALGLGVLALGRWRPTPALIPVGLVLRADPPVPRARAGPVLLCLLCISRR